MHENGGRKFLRNVSNDLTTSKLTHRHGYEYNARDWNTWSFIPVSLRDVALSLNRNFTFCEYQIKYMSDGDLVSKYDVKI
jgi:hypothetical protein